MAEPVDARGEVGADVAFQPRGARRQPHQPQLPRDLLRDRARSPRSGPAPTTVPEQVHRPRGVPQGGAPAASTGSPAPLRRCRRRRRPDGSGRGRSGSRTGARVRFRKSPRSRPQNEAVGRKPTSPASAPRSPMWLASRSSSSAMPRRHWARAGARTPDSASTAGSRRWRGRCSCRRPASRRGGWCACVGPPTQRPLDAAVLVAERDLEVEHLLAVALEAEVAGLDDAGVDGARPPPRGSRRPRPGSSPSPRPPARSPSRRPRRGRRYGGMEPHRLEPGVPLAARSPYCSAISRSNRCTCGQSGVSEAKTSAAIRGPGDRAGTPCLRRRARRTARRDPAARAAPSRRTAPPPAAPRGAPR